MERILAILANEPEYARELSAYFGSRQDFIFKPVVFTDKDVLKRYDSENAIDVLLCEEQFFSEQDDFRAECICYLTDYSIAGEASDKPRIFKYQSSERIMNEIVEYYSMRRKYFQKPGVTEDPKRRLICVCSPIGGSWCSTYALALASYYSHGGRTLFLSFDPFFLLPDEENKNTARNITDVIYYLAADGSDPAGFIKSITGHRDRLEYLSGASHWFDIADMDCALMRKLLDALTSEDGFDNIVFDAGALGAASMELYAACRNIYVTRRQGQNSDAILKEWYRQLSFAGHRELKDKVCERQLPFDEPLSRNCGFEVLLSDKLGNFIEETEGRQYLRQIN